MLGMPHEPLLRFPQQSLRLITLPLVSANSGPLQIFDSKQNFSVSEASKKEVNVILFRYFCLRINLNKKIKTGENKYKHVFFCQHKFHIHLRTDYKKVSIKVPLS